MYDVIYDEMVDAGIAVSLQHPIFTDINGIPEDHETKRFGLAQAIKITKPEWILAPVHFSIWRGSCCAIIFQGKGTVPATWKTGIDLSVTPILTILITLISSPVHLAAPFLL